MTPDLKNLAALTAINNMLHKDWFNICTVDTVARLMGAKPPDEPYNTLRALHCIHYSAMPRELRDAIPGLIKECLGVEAVYQFRTLDPEVIEVRPQPEKRGGLLRLLGR